MTQKKPERTLELHVDIDAPIEAAWKAITEGPGIANWFAPVAEVSAPGEGATVKAGWSEEMMMTSTVVAWEPLKHVRWLDESGWMGPGTSMAVDYYLSTENGKTRVRLVQSAFGASEGWDDLFDGIEDGLDLLPPEPAHLPREAPGPRAPDDLGAHRGRHAAPEVLAAPAVGRRGFRHRRHGCDEGGRLGSSSSSRSPRPCARWWRC